MLFLRENILCFVWPEEIPTGAVSLLSVPRIAEAQGYGEVAEGITNGSVTDLCRARTEDIRVLY